MTTFLFKIIRAETTGHGTEAERTEYLEAVEASIMLDVVPPAMGFVVEVLPEFPVRSLTLLATAHGARMVLPSGLFVTRLSDKVEHAPGHYATLIDRLRQAGWAIAPASRY